MKDYLEEIFAVKSVAVFFGFCGSLISLSLTGAKTPVVAVSSVASGLVCATAFTPVVHEIWTFPDSFQSSVAFILGLGGYNLVKFIFEHLNAKTFGLILSRWINRGDAREPVDETNPKK